MRAQRIIAMSARMGIQLACGLAGIAVVTGCTASPARSHHAASHHAASGTVPPHPRPLTRDAAGQCPKTIISQMMGPPGASPPFGPPGVSVWGNQALRVTLNMDGVIVANGGMIHSDGSIGWKFPWWRLVRGQLMITGKRLDAPAPPATSYVPYGYGDIGFQASGVTFSSEGCWQITGKVDRTSLTFVTLVIAEAHRAVISGTR
jgi:hypothetical protein